MNFQALLTEFSAAVESASGARLAALFTPDGVYHDTFYGEYRGRTAIAEMLEQRFWGDARAFKWDLHEAVCAGDLGYCSWLFSYTSTQGDSAGKRVAVEGMSRFRLRDGLIAHYGEKFDSGMALVQLDFAPERLVKLLRRWNAEVHQQPAMQPHCKG